MKPIADLHTHPEAARRAPVAQDEPAPRLAAIFAREGRARRIAAGETLHAEGDAARLVHLVRRGWARSCPCSEDGRRSISRFAGPGAFLGFAAGERWPFAVEAMEDVALRSLPREGFEAALARDPALAREALALAGAELEERDRRLARMARLPAEARVLRFLREFAARSPAPAWTRLPMTRADIGDHLGLSVETASRAFGALRRRGLVELRGAETFRLPATPGEGLRLAA